MSAREGMRTEVLGRSGGAGRRSVLVVCVLAAAMLVALRTGSSYAGALVAVAALIGLSFISSPGGTPAEADLTPDRLGPPPAWRNWQRTRLVIGRFSVRVRASAPPRVHRFDYRVGA